MNSDNLCSFVNLVTKPHTSYVLSVSLLLIKIALKYELMVQKDNKNVDAIFNLLTSLNLGS